MIRKAEHLSQVVRDEGMLWGEEAADAYHGVASEHMDAQWHEILAPLFEQHRFDLSRVVDFAAGFGRNTRKLLEAGAGHVVAIDVNPQCVQRLETAFAGHPVEPRLCTGFDLHPIPDESATFLYSFDAMVHFDLEIVIAYIHEFRRVLVPDGNALFHHSNYDRSPGGDFRQNPHWRNFMTAGIVQHVATRAGFEVLRQQIFDWGEAASSDCITVLRRLP